MNPAPLAGWWYLDDGRLEPILTGLLDADRWWIGVGVALVAGSLHALGPGHGKTLVGAYLASGHGRLRDAGILGAGVAAMHTATVFLVAVASYGATGVELPSLAERLLRLTSALAILLVGSLGLWRARQQAPRAGAQAPRAVVTRAHGHTHQLPQGVAPLSTTGITAIATSGGLLPSPGAFLLLATAIALGRAGYGLLLVVAFGLGLAATLAAVGVIVVAGRDRLVRRHLPAAGPWLTAVPVLGNGVVVVGGLGLALLALAGP